MAKKSNRKPLPTLEQQLAEHDVTAPLALGRYHEGAYAGSDDPERMAWARKRVELVDKIRKRDAKAMRDPGRDASGNYSPSPYAARGHKVEIAPKDLGKELPKDSQFPKRIATQRVIDRYRAHGHIDEAEWAAADKLWRLWMESGAEFRVTGGYDPIFVQSSQSIDHIMAKRVDAADMLNEIWANLPWRSRGCVRAVVIEDIPAADWSRAKGYGVNQSKTHGLNRLRLGLQALVDLFGLDKPCRT